jgi:hypothetical protein
MRRFGFPNPWLAYRMPPGNRARAGCDVIQCLLFKLGTFSYQRCMDLSLKADLDRLASLPFRRKEKTEGLMRAIHKLILTASGENLKCLGTVRRWLLVPFTLWPIDFQTLGQRLVQLQREGKGVPAEIRYLFEQVRQAPGEMEQTVVLDSERLVEKGEYERWLKAKQKFTIEDERLLRHPQFKRDWQSFKRLFDVRKHADRKGIIRRSMVQERNFRPNWGSQSETAGQVFQMAFDAFCHRWKLYGMERNRPLLLKLTVNLTAHGTMIFVPAFWSLDFQRDLHWKDITALHKARGVERQGPKVSNTKLAADEYYRKVVKLARQARAQGFRGNRRLEWITQQLKRENPVDPSTLRRWIKRGEALG